MRKKTLIFILLYISICTSSNNKNYHSKSKIIKKISVVNTPDSGFDIIYENKSFKFYFKKSLLTEFVKSNQFKYRNCVKDGVKNWNSKKGTVNYYDALWLINLHPVKYKFDSICYGAINEDKYLIICEQIHLIIWEYLKEGRFKVFDKRMKCYLQPSYIYLVETETKIPDNIEITQKYQLPNKKVILETLIEATEEFPTIEEPQSVNNKTQTFDDIK